MKIEIQTNKRNRYIGDYDYEKKLFTKKVKLSKHLFRKLDAWGIDSDYFTDVLLPNQAVIHIHDIENNFLYKINAERFYKHANYFHFKNNNEDNRSQIFCARRLFHIINLNTKSFPIATEIRQESLF